MRPEWEAEYEQGTDTRQMVTLLCDEPCPIALRAWRRTPNPAWGCAGKRPWEGCPEEGSRGLVGTQKTGEGVLGCGFGMSKFGKSVSAGHWVKLECGCYGQVTDGLVSHQ